MLLTASTDLVGEVKKSRTGGYRGIPRQPGNGGSGTGERKGHVGEGIEVSDVLDMDFHPWGHTDFSALSNGMLRSDS